MAFEVRVFFFLKEDNTWIFQQTHFLTRQIYFGVNGDMPLCYWTVPNIMITFAAANKNAIILC